MNTFTLGACFQHKLHTGPYFMTFAPRLMVTGDKSDDNGDDDDDDDDDDDNDNNDSHL